MGRSKRFGLQPGAYDEGLFLGRRMCCFKGLFRSFSDGEVFGFFDSASHPPFITTRPRSIIAMVIIAPWGVAEVQTFFGGCERCHSAPPVKRDPNNGVTMLSIIKVVRLFHAFRYGDLCSGIHVDGFLRITWTGSLPLLEWDRLPAGLCRRRPSRWMQSSTPSASPWLGGRPVPWKAGWLEIAAQAEMDAR